MVKAIKFRSLKNYPVKHVDKKGFIYWIVTDLREKNKMKIRTLK